MSNFLSFKILFVRFLFAKSVSENQHIDIFVKIFKLSFSFLVFSKYSYSAEFVEKTFMPYRELRNVKERIKEAALKIGAEKGVGFITARLIASRCNISTHTIYNNFSSMKELEKAIADEFVGFLLEESAAQLSLSFEENFIRSMKLLVAHKSETMFYLSYRTSEDCTPVLQENEELEKEYLALCNVYLRCDHHELANKEGLLDFIISTAFYYASLILLNRLPDEEETYRMVTSLLISGVKPFLAE